MYEGHGLYREKMGYQGLLGLPRGFLRVRVMTHEHANICKGRARGASHPKARVSDSDVEMIVYLHDVEGVGYKRLAKKFGCPIRTVRDFCNGRTRSALH